jgi:hypothetical protein
MLSLRRFRAQNNAGVARRFNADPNSGGQRQRFIPSRFFLNLTGFMAVEGKNQTKPTKHENKNTALD